MEQETLFTASKWEILKLLEKGPASPIELASLSRTSVANVSQQLRLLEMAGLVDSERISNREKGQPRVLYKLTGNRCYVISTSSTFVDKKFHEMSLTNKVILRIWFYPDPALQYFLEKAFWKVDHLLPKVQALGVQSKADRILFYLVASQKIERPESESVILTSHDGSTRVVEYKVVSPDKVPEGLFVLYDPQRLIGGPAG